MKMRTLLKAFFVAVLLFSMTATISASSVDTGSVSRYASSSEAYGGNVKYTVVLRDSELKEALRFLARVADLNIIIPEDIIGVVNVAFDDVSIMDAINSIVRANGLDYAVERGVMRVGKTGQFTTTGEDLKTETLRLKFATAADLVDKVKTLLTDRGSVLADERTNSIVVRERMANIENVKRFIQDIDVRDSQVLIEAKIVEATRDFSRSLGIQWGVNSGANRVNVVGIDAVGTSDSGRPLNVDLPANAPTSGLGLLIGTLAGGTNIDIQLTAAEQKGDARVISEPSIVTSNGVTAKIRSGETLLIKTTGDLNIGSTTATAGSGLHQIETGVELGVTPQISGESYVKLKIAAVTSQPDFSREVEGIPVIVDNTASTEVLVINGQTTVIGGLFKFTGSDTIKRVPFFSQIPLLGNAFKSRSKAKRNTELMIFIKPSVLKPLDQVLEDNALAVRADEMKSAVTVTPMKPPRHQPSSDTTSDEKAIVRRNPHLRYRSDD